MDETNLTDHEKAMIAKANEANVEGDPAAKPPVETSAATERPEWCPEEFWNAETGAADTEALARKYAEVTAPKEPPKEEPKPEGEGNTPADPPFVAAVEAANADILNNNGVLTEETYKGFEKLGLGRDHIDAYIEGQQAKAELVKMRIHGETGGEENLKRMIEWGAVNYTETERDMFDKMMHSGNVDQALGATRALQARFEASEGKSGNVVTPGGQSNAAPGGFTTKDEVVAAMGDKRYNTNAAYRKEVQAKIEAALKAGTNLGF